MDSERFLGGLRDAVNDVRAAEEARRLATAGTSASYRAALDHRRLRDELTSLVSRHPEEFAGLVVALADRLARVEESVQDIRSHLLSGEQLV